MVFISIQALFAVKGFLSGADWVRDALDRSWTNAYETDKDLIRDLQSEVCLRFHAFLFHPFFVPVKRKVERDQAGE